jgi:uncharacterized pyridoxal phosphate-containing UPF0001 family protein
VAAYAAGQRDFGENYAQELRDKSVELAHLPELRWHAIGTLQRNKVKYVAKAACSFQALCSLEIAEELGSRRDEPPHRRSCWKSTLLVKPVRAGSHRLSCRSSPKKCDGCPASICKD